MLQTWLKQLNYLEKDLILERISCASNNYPYSKFFNENCDIKFLTGMDLKEKTCASIKTNGPFGNFQ